MNPLDQTCQRCGAQPGQKCHTPNGGYSVPHATRRGTPGQTRHRNPLTPELTEAIAKDVAKGVPLAYAAPAHGIGQSTIYNWLTLATIDDPKYAPHRAMRERLERARAEAAVKHVDLINTAAEGGYVIKQLTRTFRDGTSEIEEQYAPMEWRASSFLLERLFREFGRREVLEWASSPEGMAPESGAGVLSAQGVDRIADQLRLFRERREIEAAGEAGVVDAEVVEDA